MNLKELSKIIKNNKPEYNGHVFQSKLNKNEYNVYWFVGNWNPTESSSSKFIGEVGSPRIDQLIQNI